MADPHGEFQNYMSIQRDMFRMAKRDYALSPKRLHILSKLPEPTIRTWANGTAMPAWAFSILCRHIPDELTSMLMDPSEKHVGTNDAGEGDLDALTCEAAGFTHAVLDAKRDGTVTPMERRNLAEHARRLAPRAIAVARVAA